MLVKGNRHHQCSFLPHRRRPTSPMDAVKAAGRAADEAAIAAGERRCQRCPGISPLIDLGGGRVIPGDGVPGSHDGLAA